MNEEQKKIKTLENKSKAGWKMYFDLKQEHQELIEYMCYLRRRNIDLANKIHREEPTDINHLKTQFIEMYDELKKKTECPICLEDITKENIKITNCGHIFCKTCELKLSNCAVCRKKIYRARN